MSGESASRRRSREVRGAEETRFGADVIDGFAPGPDVIAGGHHVNAAVEQRLAHLARDAEAGCRILHVGHHEIDSVVFDNSRQATLHDVAARAADDIADEQETNHDPITGTTMARLARRSLILGSRSVSRPDASVALLSRVLHEAVSRTIRAKRPKPRSTR